MAAINNNLPGKAVMVVNAGEPSNPPYGFRYREGAQKDWDNMFSVLNDLGFEMLNSEGERSYNVSLSRWDHTKTRDEVGHAQGNNHPAQAQNPPSERCCLKCLIQHHNFGSASSFAFYISTHGLQERGVLSVQFLSDYENTYDSITVKEIVQTMSSNPTLKDKPKILIVQACREDDMHLDIREDKGVVVKVAGTVDANTDPQNGQRMAGDVDNAMRMEPGDAGPPPPLPNIFPDLPTVDFKIPRRFLLLFPTTPYRTSKRNTQEGSWFEYHLKEALDEHTEPVVDFLELITLTSNKVAARSSVVYMGGWKDGDGRRIKNEQLSGMKNAVCVEHRLCEPLYFRKVGRSVEPMDDRPAI